MKVIKPTIYALIAGAALSVCTVPIYSEAFSDSFYQSQYGQPGDDRIIDINGYWYFIGSDGFIKYGWQQLDGQWYYFNDEGHKVTGWLSYGENWYYLNADGTMAADQVVQGFYIDSSGIAAGDTQAAREYPDFDIYWVSDLKIDGVTAIFRIFNWGTLPITIKNKSSYMEDNYTDAYNRTLSPVSLDGPNQSPVTADELLVPEGEERLICFSSLEGPDRFHQRSTFYFTFEYDGIEYNAEYFADGDTTINKVEN